MSLLLHSLPQHHWVKEIQYYITVFQKGPSQIIYNSISIDIRRYVPPYLHDALHPDHQNTIETFRFSINKIQTMIHCLVYKILQILTQPNLVQLNLTYPNLILIYIILILLKLSFISLKSHKLQAHFCFRHL